MSKCDVYLHLDKTRFRQLEEITGEVRVRVNKDCKCKGLVLRASWRTSGKGDVNFGNGSAVTLFQGTWKAGQQQIYRFSLPTTGGPCTYKGKLISINWTLKAQADIPWALDPKDKKPFWLDPGPVSNYFAGRSFKRPSSLSESKSRNQMIMWGTLIASVCFMSGLQHLVHSDFHSIRLLFEAFGFLLGVGVASFQPVRRLLASRKLGKVSVYIPYYVIHPGGVLPVKVTLEGGKGQVVKNIFAQLKCIEAATYTRSHMGTSSSHRTDESVTVHHTVFSRKFTTSIDGAGRRSMSQGRALQKDLQVNIPDDAFPSFTFGYNRLTWFLSVQIEIPGWPDWKKTMEIAVLPSRSYKPPATIASRVAPGLLGGAPKSIAAAAVAAAPVAAVASVAPAASVADAIPALAPLTPGRAPAPLKPGAPPAGFSPPAPLASRVRGEKAGQRFAVAVCRWARPPAEVAQSLASHFGMTAYDLSMQLSGPLPLIVGQDMDAEEAGGLVEILMEQGHRVITLDMGLVPEPEALITVRDFRLREQGLLVLDERKVKHELAWSEVQALIRAVHQDDPKKKRDKDAHSVSLGQKRSDERLADTDQSAREQALYLVPKDARRTLLFRENRVRYQGLGSRMAQTKQQSFLTLVDILRKLAPEAFFDERLCRSIYTEGQSAMKAVKKSSGSSDNHASVTDLMVQVLLAAKQQGQL